VKGHSSLSSPRYSVLSEFQPPVNQSARVMEKALGTSSITTAIYAMSDLSDRGAARVVAWAWKSGNGT
jgi:hypothetical protein